MGYQKEDFEPRYLIIIGGFYAGQGYSLGSLVFLLPLYILNELNAISRSQAVTVAAIIILPWYVKFIFGLITDNQPIMGYRRKPYLVIATILSLLGWTTLGLSSTISPLFLLSGFSLATGSALGDAVIDGLSVEITPSHYTGRLQGVNWGSRGIGLGLSGVVSANIVDQFGWNEMFAVAGFFGVIITVITLVLPELHFEFQPNQKWSSMITHLKHIIQKERTRYRIGYFLFSGVALSVVLQLTLIMETEFGYNFRLLGFGALSFAVGTFIGSIIYGTISDRNDTLQSFISLSVFYGIIIIIGMGFEIYRDFTLEMIYFFAVGLLGGAYEAYQLKIIQEETAERLESTIFAIYTGISNIGQIAIGGVIVVFLADTLNFSILYSMQVVLFMLILAGYMLFELKFSHSNGIGAEIS